jgi:hypothetical protein
MVWAVLAVAAAASTAEAARLDLRLVEASTSEQDSDRRLNDILPLLSGNLKFTSFALVGHKSVPFGPADTVDLGKDYSISLSDVDDSSVSVQITHRKQKLLKTRLRLRPERPVLMGAFPDGGKTLIIVITLHDQ